MSEKVPHVYAAIHAVLSELSVDGISKDNKNAQQGYKFRGIDDVLNALSGALARNKLIILPTVLSRTVSEGTSKNGGVLFYVVADVEYTFISVVDGSSVKARLPGEAMDSADKATNKAMSAAYKYMAIQSFAIPTQGDNDADATTHEVERRPVQRPPVQQPPADTKVPVGETGERQKRGPADGHPIMLQLEVALNKYGTRRAEFEGILAGEFKTDSIYKIPVPVLPQALLRVVEHQKAAKAAKAAKAGGEKPVRGAKKKANLPPPDRSEAPDQQVDDYNGGDDGIPV
jgi:hypothetical protein